MRGGLLRRGPEVGRHLKEGVAETPPAAGEDLETFVRQRFWKARYLPCTKAP